MSVHKRAVVYAETLSTADGFYLRHSHATQLLSAGVHPKVAQERLGHATITTTLDLYSHVTETMQSDAAERLDALFRTAITQSAGAK
jgi:site-specific recombinase XerD